MLSADCCRIQRNKERLSALHIPTLATRVAPVKKTVHKRKSDVRKKENEEDPGARRSTRLRAKVEEGIAVKKEEEETVEDEFERILGEFIIDGACPKCSKIYQKGHRRHLINCSGQPAPPSRSRLDKQLLLGLSEEDKKNERKKMLARMSALSISGLDDFNDECATIGVIGSTGKRYVVTFQDAGDSLEYRDFPRKCQCIDSRCRRRDCKHICLVMQLLGIDLDISREEFNATWRNAINDNIKDLIIGVQDMDDIPYTMPEGKNAKIGQRFLHE